MTVTVNLPPETEARLESLARARGVDLSDLVRRFVEERLQAEIPQPPGTLETRLAAWRALGKGLPPRPPLSDEAISRETMYDSDGE